MNEKKCKREKERQTDRQTGRQRKLFESKAKRGKDKEKQQMEKLGEIGLALGKEENK